MVNYRALRFEESVVKVRLDGVKSENLIKFGLPTTVRIGIGSKNDVESVTKASVN